MNTNQRLAELAAKVAGRYLTDFRVVVVGFARELAAVVDQAVKRSEVVTDEMMMEMDEKYDSLIKRLCTRIVIDVLIPDTPDGRDLMDTFWGAVKSRQWASIMGGKAMTE